LWHYTDFAAFKSIVEKGTMWASNLQYLSDTAEFNYTLELIRETLETKGVIPDDLSDIATADGMFQGIDNYMRFTRYHGVYAPLQKRPDPGRG